MDSVCFPTTHGFYETLSEETEKIMLILDTRGYIRYCDAPGLLAEKAELLGQSISVIAPGLPFRPRTPGYNVAYTRFAFEDRWQRQLIKLSNGRAALMDVQARAVPIAHGYCLLMLLRPVRDVRKDLLAREEPRRGHVPFTNTRHQQGVAEGAC